MIYTIKWSYTTNTVTDFVIISASTVINIVDIVNNTNYEHVESRYIV